MGRSMAGRTADPRVLALAALTAPLAWASSIAVWRAGGKPGLAVSLFGLGVSLGPCLAAYASAPSARKQVWRQAVLATGGASILVFAFAERTGLDLESFLSSLFLGTVSAAVGHTVVTTIVGPLVFGRLLCGWGCWRAMVLEHLPVGEGTGRRRGRWWRRLPMAGLGAAVAVAVYAAFGTGAVHSASLVPVTTGVAVYYALALGFAFALRDRRAFCKYLCPTGQVLRWTSAHSLLAIRARAARCTGCGTCSTVCPMDIDVSGRARLGGRIGGGDCILCQRCVLSCPSDALAYRTGA